MEDLILISQNEEIVQNLLPNSSCLLQNTEILYTGNGDAYILQSDSNSIFNYLGVLQIVNNVDENNLFSLPDAFIYRNFQSGIFTFSFYMKSFSNDAELGAFNLTLNVFKNGSLSEVFTQTFDFSENNPLDYYRFAQSFNCNPISFEDLSFSIEVNRVVGGTGAFIFQGFQLQKGNLTNYSVPFSTFSTRPDFLISETEWNVPSIVTQTINNGDSFNLLNLINNTTNKNTINSDVFDQLNIISNAIRTTYRGCKIAHTVRVRINIATGSDQHYQLQIRRAVDNSIVYRAMLERNPDETTQTIEMTTRTLNASDPYVVDGFYLAFVNNSGASCTIDGELSLVIISHYQKSQNGN